MCLVQHNNTEKKNIPGPTDSELGNSSFNNNVITAIIQPTIQLGKKPLPSRRMESSFIQIRLA